MATIGVRNWRLRAHALQCTVSDGKRRGKVVHVVPWPCPSGSKTFIGISCIMQVDPPCTELTHPTAHCPHRRTFQVIFGNRDGGELGFFPLQRMLLIVYVANSVTLAPHKPYPSSHIHP